jgi:hypothetical protein
MKGSPVRVRASALGNPRLKGVFSGCLACSQGSFRGQQDGAIRAGRRLLTHLEPAGADARLEAPLPLPQRARRPHLAAQAQGLRRTRCVRSQGRRPGSAPSLSPTTCNEWRFSSDQALANEQRRPDRRPRPATTRSRFSGEVELKPGYGHHRPTSRIAVAASVAASVPPSEIRSGVKLARSYNGLERLRRASNAKLSLQYV